MLNKKLTSSYLMNNCIINFFGQIITFPIIFFTIPYVVNKLGDESFGVFSLIKIFIDYFTIVEFGLAGSTVKFMGEALGKKDAQRVIKIFWSSLLAILIIGLLGGVVFYILVPIFAQYFLKVGADYLNETKYVYRISSCFLPLILMKSLLNGVLEANQRFDLSNFVKIPSIILSAVVPVILAYLGYNLPIIVIGLVIVETLTIVTYFLICQKIIPNNRISFFNFSTFKPLLDFGGWLCLIKIINWIMINIQNILLGSLLTVASVTYYSLPYRLADKIGIIGASIAPVVYSSLSMYYGVDDKKSKKIFNYSFKYLIILYMLPTMLLFLFAKEIIILWLGDDFGVSIIVLQILSIGMLFSGISWILGTFIQSAGKPKLISIMALCQVPFEVFVAWLLVVNSGISGAAVSWTVFRLISTVVLYVLCYKLKIFVLVFNNKALKGISFITFFIIVSFIVKNISDSAIFYTIGNILFFTLFYCYISWKCFFDNSIKKLIIDSYLPKI